MEGWYEQLTVDSRATTDCFEHDYTDLAPLLGRLSGAVLDVGGGLGVARQFLPPDASCLIVEPSDSWLDPRWSILEDRYPVLRQEADWIRGTGESLPLRSGCFDAVLALWSLNHTSDPERTITEVHRVLRPGGRFVVVLEDVAATLDDLGARPDLSEYCVPGAVQSDHIAISESRFQDAVTDRFTVVERRWVKHYLLLDLTRNDAGAHSRVQPAAEPREPDASRPSDEQVSWWKGWFESRGLSWPSDFETRLSVEAPIQTRIASHLPADGASILDVGSGPLPRVGRRHGRVPVRVTAVDPLADQYRALLALNGHDVALGPIKGEAEELGELFGPDTFDVVNMENALDQCRDPVRAVRSMIEVVKPGASVLLLHEENAGDGGGYQGACPWNVTEDRGHFIVWNREVRTDVTEALAGLADVRVFRSEDKDYVSPIEVEITKRASARSRRAQTGALDAGSLSGPLHVRAVLWTLVRTDFKVRYHGSVGGFAWALLRPLSLFVVLQAVFSLMFRSDPQYRLNLVIGLFLWDFFVESSKAGMASLASKAHLLTKVRLPAWLLVVASMANALITLGFFIALIVTTLALGDRPPSVTHAALFLTYLVQFLMIIVGFSLAASALFLRYRDLNQLWDLVTQVGFFAAPIVYPLALLPERVHVYLYAWPPTPIIQFSRSVLVEGLVPSGRAHALLFAEAVVSLVVGAAVFHWNARRAAEYL